jgi:hypothetical protein
MSQHIVVQEGKKFVFGWDQPLMSFFLQVHNTRRDEDDQIVVWLGTTLAQMPEVQNLVLAAHAEGLLIDHETRVKLYGEKDDGR